jgi:hypothetical protein
MIDGQSASLSCYRTTIWDPSSVFLSRPWNLSSDSCGLFPYYGAPPLKRNRVCIRKCSTVRQNNLKLFEMPFTRCFHLKWPSSTVQKSISYKETAAFAIIIIIIIIIIDINLLIFPCVCPQYIVIFLVYFLFSSPIYNIGADRIENTTFNSSFVKCFLSNFSPSTALTFVLSNSLIVNWIPLEALRLSCVCVVLCSKRTRERPALRPSPVQAFLLAACKSHNFVLNYMWLGRI